MMHLRFMRSAWLGIVFGVFLTAESVSGANTAWNVSTGDWSVAGNWTNGEPTSADNAYINNNGTATVSQAGEVCTNLYLQKGGIRMNSGSLTVSTGGGEQHGDNGICTFEQNGGTHASATVGLASLLTGSTYPCTYRLTGGILTNWWLRLGWNANADFIQTGGSNFAGRLDMCGNGASLTATYTMSGGLFRVSGWTYVGLKAPATFNQYGGRFEPAYGGWGMYVPQNSGAGNCKYNLRGGELSMTAGSGFDIYGRGEFNIGTTNGTASLMSGNNLAAGTAFTESVTGAVIRGWGTVGFTGKLVNNGKVIADGWAGTATDRTLDLSSFTALEHTALNTNSAGLPGSNGWYALNRGKLILPPLTITTGTSTQNWGDVSTHGTNDLVNSIGLVFSNVTAGGAITNALLAVNRGDIPAMPPRKFFSVWQMRSAAELAFQSMTLSFRYDEDGRAVQNIPVANLTVWHSTGGLWSALPTTVNAVTKQVAATVTSLATNEFFAVGAPWIPGGTVFLVR